ncbi:hypothetical protein DRE_03960 [Drechslerella stenobrocha 248]|uniref:BRCT domain-containing protein n=1 Tax=Drechslerella stenobrocha 248 TaxID=1043628 RepID=W7IC88_9PEZI|nr:hypothetical protein DRE_03960 [Drechslerella stenobrocha 248]
MPPLKGSELKKALVELASTTRPGKPHDVYVSSSTGHQIREDGGSVTGWRDDRNRKLKAQFANTGSVIGTKRKLGEMVSASARADNIYSPLTVTQAPTTATTQPAITTLAGSSSSKPKQIFANCTIYINGNTALSGISDVELKRLLTAHGAKVSYHLARRQVTHIILTHPPASPAPSSSSSSQPPPSSSCHSSSATRASKTTASSVRAILASRKVELEIKGRAISKMHYVTVEWALASMKEEKRLAETRFPVTPLRDARQGTLSDCKRVKSSQRSLVDMVKRG